MIYLVYGLGCVITLVVLLSMINITKRRYKGYIRRNDLITDFESDLLAEHDIKDLPTIIQKYLRYTKVIGKEKVKSYNVKMTGEMKLDMEKPFVNVVVDQKSFVEPTTRLFYIKMIFKGLKIVGLHHYENAKASMIIRILDLFKVVDERGESMNKAETVTVLNDMMLMAPATLIDERFTFEEIDETNIRVSFTNKRISVSAVATFEEDGRLVNFVSNDRIALINGVEYNVPWSTPMTEYKDMGDFYLPYKGSAVWHFEGGDFVYAKIMINDVEYNKRKS